MYLSLTIRCYLEDSPTFLGVHREMDNMDTENIDVDENDTQFTKHRRLLPNIPLEDTTLNFNLVSLKNITRSKIVSSLWMNSLKEITNIKHSSSELKKEWEQIEINISTKASQLSLPNFIICNELISIINPLGNALREWISDLDCCIFNAHGVYEHAIFDDAEPSKKFVAMDFIDNIQWTSRGKIEYQQTAKNILAKENNELSDNYKYMLACMFCLKDAIMSFPTPHHVITDFINSKMIKYHALVYYWISFPYNVYGPYSNNLDVIFDLVYTACYFNQGSHFFNEVAIKYLWNTLSKEDKASYVGGEERNNLDDLYSLQYFLELPYLSFERQQEVIRERSFAFRLLSDILKDWTTEERFLPTAFRLFDVMNSQHFFLTLKLILTKIKESAKKNERVKCDHWNLIFRQLWYKAPKRLRDPLLLNKRNEFEVFMTALSWVNDIDIIQFFLTRMPLEKREVEIYCNWTKWEEMIINDQWDLLNIFMDHTLFPEEKCRELKQRIVEHSGIRIAKNFFQRNLRNKMEYFLDWAFTTDEQKNHFKQKVMAAAKK